MEKMPNTEQRQNLDDKRRHPRFAIRLTDRETAQLKQIAETTPESMHQFCIRAIRAALSEKVEPDAQHATPVRAIGSQRVQCPNCNHALFDLLS